jgi:hypothetical protein
LSGVPQAGQKLRTAPALDRNRVGVPARSRNSARGTLNHATNGAPLTRRHIEQ